MSYQSIIQIGIAMHKHETEMLRQSYCYNATMADHYFKQYERYCLGWKFTRAAFCFIKWQQFEKQCRLIDAKLQLSTFQKN